MIALIQTEIRELIGYNDSIDTNRNYRVNRL